MSQEEEIMKKWEARIQRGYLRIICLRVYVNRERLSGHELREHIRNMTSGSWDPSPGSIYPILNEMEREGILELVKKSKKIKTYAITELGHRIHKNLISSSSLFGQKADMNFDFLHSEDFSKSISRKYGSMNLRELKLHYELHKKITEILAKMLQEKVLEETEI